jgi:hypothetical protein
VWRRYDVARTPYRRALAETSVGKTLKHDLALQYVSLAPWHLHQRTATDPRKRSFSPWGTACSRSSARVLQS